VRLIDSKLNCGRPSPNAAILADRFSWYSAECRQYIACVRRATEGATEATYIIRKGHCFNEFAGVSTEDVIAAFNHSPQETSAADVLPVSVLKQVTVETCLFVTELYSQSLRNWTFPYNCKPDFVTPVIKKPCLDQSRTEGFQICRLFRRYLRGSSVAQQTVIYLLSKKLLLEF
jgi:hypothetical protein